MKAIVQWIVLYVVIFGIIGSLLLFAGDSSGQHEVNWEDIKGIFSDMGSGLWSGGKSAVESIVNIEVITKEDLYKYAPKLCKVDSPFTCTEFLLNTDIGQMILVLEKQGRITPIGAQIEEGITCLSEVAEGDDNIVYVRFYECNITQNYAQIAISYQKIESTLEHRASGMVSLGLK